ncbi:MAG TPA: ATP-binding protein [Usitatibacter sp.]|nr:ATP-binding protein [Usitatibacter sp.]
MSMRRRLLVWLLTGMLLAGLAITLLVFYQARSTANEMFDYQLKQIALALRDRAYLPGDLAETLQAAEGLDFVIQAWTPDGRLVYESHPQIAMPATGVEGFSDVKTQLGTWRVYAIWHRGLSIQVAQHRLARDALAFNAAWRTLLPFLVALPFMGFLIWTLVGREVKVLEKTAQAVAKRTPESLEPIESAAVPEEVQPLVGALNGLMGRLGDALGQQRQFIADAAHELRTPLTALRLQLDLAERARDDAQRAQAHAMLRDGIARATHVVEQLLALARADPQVASVAKARFDMAELARAVVESERAFAEARSMELAVSAEVPVEVDGDRATIRALMENLVDNAVTHTPAGSKVTVRCYAGVNEALFEVEDTGPGIAPAERERVFDRFYRSETAAEGGSGLGLAIVRRIAERHGGRVQLLDTTSGQGLLARVSIPCAP